MTTWLSETKCVAKTRLKLAVNILFLLHQFIWLSISKASMFVVRKQASHSWLLFDQTWMERVLTATNIVLIRFHQRTESVSRKIRSKIAQSQVSDSSAKRMPWRKAGKMWYRLRIMSTQATWLLVLNRITYRSLQRKFQIYLVWTHMLFLSLTLTSFWTLIEFLNVLSTSWQMNSKTLATFWMTQIISRLMSIKYSLTTA